MVRFLFFIFVFALLLGREGMAAPPNVILFMVDGVRWEEFFHGADPLIDPAVNPWEKISPFQDFLSKPASNSFIWGDRKKGHDITVSNRAVLSLPAYQSIMAGQNTRCLSNACGRIEVETLQERLVKELGLKKQEVATVASWPKIALAVEKEEGRTLVNVGIQENQESGSDPIILELNEKQKKDTPSWDARKDEYTFDQAIAVLKNNKPRFLFISLDDADEFGHKGQYKDYLTTLKSYQEKLTILLKTLDGMGDYGHATSVIMTTDHGRGEGRNWTDHNADLPAAKYIWMFAKGPRVTKKAAHTMRAYTHLDIRPTIEKLMGLKPISCGGCGQVISEIAGD